MRAESDFGRAVTMPDRLRRAATHSRRTLDARFLLVTTTLLPTATYLHGHGHGQWSVEMTKNRVKRIWREAGDRHSTRRESTVPLSKKLSRI